MCQAFSHWKCGDCRRPSDFDRNQVDKYERRNDEDVQRWNGRLRLLEGPEVKRQENRNVEQAKNVFKAWKLHMQKAKEEYDERVRREKHARRVAKEQERAMKKERKKQGRHA